MNLDRVGPLWVEGLTIREIAKRLRVSRSTLYGHIRRGTLVLPERPWVPPSSLDVANSTLITWHERGLVRRTSDGMYHVDDVRRVLESRTGRMCAHPRCGGVIDNRNPRARFCPRHTDRGVDPDRVVRIVGQKPGINRSRLHQRLGVTSTVARPVLAGMVAKGLLQTADGPRGAKLYFPAA